MTTNLQLCQCGGFMKHKRAVVNTEDGIPNFFEDDLDVKVKEGSSFKLVDNLYLCEKCKQIMAYKTKNGYQYSSI